MTRATYLPMGPAPCSVGFCLDDETYLAEMRALKIKDFNPFISPGADATVHEFQSTATVPIALLCIDTKQRRSLTSSAALIAHEAVHILQFIKREMREREAGAEFEAYTVQWVVQEVLRDYLKAKRRG
jgi:hypothetical protein